MSPEVLSIDLMLAYLVMLGIGVLMLFMPALSRGSTFFAVTVPEGFASSEIGRSIRRRYQALTIIPTLLALAAIAPVYRIFSGDTAAAVAYGVAPLVPVIGALAALVHCRGVAMRFSRDASSTRQVSLRRDSLADIVPGPWWLHVLPYLLLATARRTAPGSSACSTSIPATRRCSSKSASAWVTP